MIKVGEVVLERYRVVEQIGSGGHSIVFRGQDERLSRPVCIKVFAHMDGTSGVGRTSYEHFVQEAFALSRLTHPNTLRIYDFGHLGAKDADGLPIQVCEYMNGGTLAQTVREEGTQSLAETVRVISAMCAALSEAHELGIVHRDIKPQNILFGTAGGGRLPKLADFGIAKWSADTEDSGQRAEDTAIVAGQKLAMYSPSWAAPEQLAGQPVNATTDIYSLAVVAIYMLTGKAIFAEEDVYAGYKKRRRAEELVRTTLEPIGVPGRMIDVLCKALMFDPKQRLAKVEELAQGLAEALEPVPAAAEDSKRTPVAYARTMPQPVVGEDAASGQGTGTLSEVTDPIAQRPPPRAFPAPIATNHAMPAPMPIAQPPVAQVAPPVRPLMLVEYQPAAERNVHFVQLGATLQTDLVGPQGMRIRITLIHGPSGLVIHCKGMSCFVAMVGGRPSPAVQIDRPSNIALVTPRAQEVGYLRVENGTLEQGTLVFSLGNERVGIRTDDCADPILFDFGPGSDAYFVYTRGRSVPRSSPRR
jgi:serine/threonine-protein kinase